MDPRMIKACELLLALCQHLRASDAAGAFSAINAVAPPLEQQIGDLLRDMRARGKQDADLNH